MTNITYQRCPHCGSAQAFHVVLLAECHLEAIPCLRCGEATAFKVEDVLREAGMERRQDSALKRALSGLATEEKTEHERDREREKFRVWVNGKDPCVDPELWWGARGRFKR